MVDGMSVRDGGKRPGSRAAWLAACWLLMHGTARAQFVPFQDEPIRYSVDPPDDPVARLQKSLASGERRLEFNASHGYLRSVLRALDVPESSQALVFSRSSLQFRHVSPETPRAIYFNDDVYVGWVQGGEFLEIASFDARQGAIFYTLDQQRSDSPGFKKGELDCLQCHVGARTQKVPGVLLRSIPTTATGDQAPRSKAFVTDHRSPIAERWGGWYVTGTIGGRGHLGNIVAGRDQDGPANLTELSSRFTVAPYVNGHSDVVAHLVLDHQVQLHNLITKASYEARLALHAESAAGRTGATLSPEARRRIEGPAEELVRYLLFADEAPLDGPIAGASGFAEEFAARGPRDPAGRSLREFDLKRRIFRHPCSYLIDSESFDALPDITREYVYRRIAEVLTGIDRGPGFDRLDDESRLATLEILKATKPEFAAHLRDHAPRPVAESGG